MPKEIEGPEGDAVEPSSVCAASGTVWEMAGGRRGKDVKLPYPFSFQRPWGENGGEKKNRRKATKL